MTGPLHSCGVSRSQPAAYTPHLVADLFATIQDLKQQVQVLPQQAAPLSVVRSSKEAQMQTATLMAAIVQLESQLKTYTQQTHAQITASEERVERQIHLMRQQLLLIMADLDTHVAEQVKEALAPFQTEQAALAAQLASVEQEVTVHRYDLFDVQTQLTHHIDYTEDRLEQHQDGFQKLLVVGVAIAIGCLALPIALQWSTHSDLAHPTPSEAPQTP